jgi:DNA-binding NarL/FixJ family response regulator
LVYISKTVQGVQVLCGIFPMILEPIRVVIVDDHSGVRAGIRYILVNAKDINVVGEGANGVEAVQLASTHKPDVMLLDVELPLLKGDEAVRVIKDNHPEVKVLAVSSYSDRQYIQEMMANGASGYITKDEVPEFLLEAVRSIYNENHTWLSPLANRINRSGG